MSSRRRLALTLISLSILLSACALLPASAKHASGTGKKFGKHSAVPLANDDYEAARVAYNLEKFSTAFNLCRVILTAHPDDVKARILRGCCYLRTGDSENAMSDFDRSITLDPLSESAFLNRGILLMLNGEYQKAINDFYRTLELDPGDGTAAMRQAVCFQLLEESDKAIQSYTLAMNAFKDDCDESKASEAESRIALLSKPGIEAQSCIRLANCEAHLEIAEELYGQTRYARAVQECSDAIKLNPRSPEAFFGRGLNNCASREYQSAITDFSQVIALHPSDPAGWFYRGVTNVLRNQFDSAADDFKKTLSLSKSPGNKNYEDKAQESLDKLRSEDVRERLKLHSSAEIEAFETHAKTALMTHRQARKTDLSSDVSAGNGEGSSETPAAEKQFSSAQRLVGTGKFNAALSGLDEAIRINPKVAKYQTLKANCHRELKQYDLALSAYAQALILDPKEKDSLLGRADCYVQMNRLGQAADDYQQLATIAAKSDNHALTKRALDLATKCLVVVFPEAMKHMSSADNYLENDKFEQATNEYSEVIKSVPNFFFAFQNRGKCHYKLGHYVLALADFKRAARLNPLEPEILMEEGSCFGVLANLKRSINCFQSAETLYKRSGDLKNADAVRERIEGAALLTAGNDAANDHYYASMLLVFDGRFANAVSELNEVLAMRPAYANGYSSRASCFLKLNQLDKALADYLTAAMIDPNNPDIWFNKSVTLSALGKSKEAASSFKRTALLYERKNNNKDAEESRQRAIICAAEAGKKVTPQTRMANIHFNKGNVFLRESQWEQAIEEYDATLKLNSKHLSALNNRSLCHKSLAQYQQAIDDNSQSIRIDPKYADAYFNRGIAYGLLGHSEHSVEDLQKAAQLYGAQHKPDRVLAAKDMSVTVQSDMLYIEAGGLFDEKQYSRCIEKLSRLLLLNPNYGNAYLLRGLCYTETGDREKALSQFDLAVKSDPTSPEGYYRRGITFAAAKKYNGAADDLAKAATLFEKGRDNVHAKQARDKLQVVEAFLKNPPNSAASQHFQAATTLYGRALYGEALKEFDQAIALVPADPAYRTARGDCNFMLKDLKNAAADYEKAIDIDGTFARGYAGRAAILFREAEYERGLIEATRALSLDPEMAAVYQSRAIAYEYLDKEKEAVEDLEKAASLYEARGETSNIASAKNSLQKVKSDGIDCVSAALHATVANDWLLGRYYDRAVEEAGRAILLDPNNASAYYIRGLAVNHQRYGDRQVAADLRKAADLFSKAGKKSDADKAIMYAVKFSHPKIRYTSN